MGVKVCGGLGGIDRLRKGRGGSQNIQTKVWIEGPLHRLHLQELGASALRGRGDGGRGRMHPTTRVVFACVWEGGGVRRQIMACGQVFEEVASTGCIIVPAKCWPEVDIGFQNLQLLTLGVHHKPPARGGGGV